MKTKGSQISNFKARAVPKTKQTQWRRRNQSTDFAGGSVMGSAHAPGPPSASSEEGLLSPKRNHSQKAPRAVPGSVSGYYYYVILYPLKITSRGPRSTHETEYVRGHYHDKIKR